MISAAEKGGEDNNLLAVRVCGMREGVKTNFVFIAVQGKEELYGKQDFKKDWKARNSPEEKNENAASGKGDVGK